MLKNTVVYLMRHGLDDERFIGGWSNGGLLQKGIQQVESAKDFIVTNIDGITKIYNSGICRASETAEIINKELELSIIELEELKELNKGKLNGMAVNEAKELYPEFFPAPSIHQKFPEGESFQDLYDRTKIFLENIDNYDKSLLITHRGIINMIYFILNDMDINYDKTQFDVVHASIHKIELEKIKRIF
jgi:probable phosphoglycerate mutase